MGKKTLIPEEKWEGLRHAMEERPERGRCRRPRDFRLRRKESGPAGAGTTRNILVILIFHPEYAKHSTLDLTDKSSTINYSTGTRGRNNKPVRYSDKRVREGGSK